MAKAKSSSKSSRGRKRSYLFWSVVLHVLLLSCFVIGFQFHQSMPVFELTQNAHDTINAVVLGETKESKIMPKQEPSLLPQEVPLPKKIETAKQEKPIEKPKPKEKPLPEKPKDVIPLAKKPDKKVIQKKEMKSILDEFAEETKAHKKKEQAALKKKVEKVLSKVQDQDIEKTFRESTALSEVNTKSTVSRKVSSGVVDRYRALIIQSISQEWRVPLGASKDLVSELTIRLAPGGKVLEVNVSRSSGNTALDRSAKNAVMKASPLPVPSDPAEFELFREFVLKVKPEYVTENGLG